MTSRFGVRKLIKQDEHRTIAFEFDGLNSPRVSTSIGIDAGTEAQSPVDPGPHSPTTLGAHFGEIVWLLSRSEAHRHLFLADLEWLVMPPMLLRQYRLFRGPPPERAVVGLALWAFLSEAVEKRVKAGVTRFQAEDWQSGNRPWLVDVVAIETQIEAIRMIYK